MLEKVKVKWLTGLLAVVMVFAMMPMTMGMASAETDPVPLIDPDQYYKIILDTAGKVDITSIDTSEWREDDVFIREQEPNVIYVKKDFANELNLYLSVILGQITIPDVKGFSLGPGFECPFSLKKPEAIKNWDEYYNAVNAFNSAQVCEECESSGSVTVYFLWFEQLDKMKVDVTAPICKQEIKEDTVAGITVPKGEKWSVSEGGSWEWHPSWIEWKTPEYLPLNADEKDGDQYPVPFIGTVKGGNEYEVIFDFTPKYGYIFKDDYSSVDITVTYKNQQGKTVKGQVGTILNWPQNGEGETYTITAKVKAQHVPGKATKKNVVKPTCTKDGSHNEVISCTKCKKVLSTKKVTDKALGHKWGKWIITKQPTATKKGEKKRVCKNNKSHVQKKEIPAKGKKKSKGKLLATMTPVGKTSMKLKWNALEGADGYDVFFSRCNYKNKELTPIKVATLEGNGNVSWTNTGLKAHRSYKAYVKAWTKKKGKTTYIIKSPTYHGYTAGWCKKFTNPKSVTVQEKQVKLNIGKKTQIEAQVLKVKAKKKLISKAHSPRLRYLSSDAGIAKVNKSGKVTAISKGTCTVYVFAASGVMDTVDVTVK